MVIIKYIIINIMNKEILEKNYADSDWHELFVGEIVAAFKKV